MEGRLSIAKLVAAAALVAAFCLPLARCARDRQAPAPPARPQAVQAPAPPVTYSYHYAWTDFSPRSPESWLLLLAFFWPLPLALWGMRRATRGGPWLPGLEALLAVGSAYLIFRRTILMQLWTGGYLAYGALTLYLLACLGQIWGVMVRRRRSGASPAAGAARPAR